MFQDMTGADALAAFTSIIQTLLKHGTRSSMLEPLSDLFRSQELDRSR